MAKRILVTGGAGFIGSHLVRDLVNAGHSVRVLDNFSEQVHGKNPRIPDGFSEVELIRGDIRSRGAVTDALRDVQVVFHLAAAVGVGQSMYEVQAYTDTNNTGTANLLQCLIDHRVERLVVASSMSLYGEGLYSDQSGAKVIDAKRDLDRLKSREWDPRAPDGSPLLPLPTPESKRPDLASVYALSKFDQEVMCALVGKAYGIPTVALRLFNVYGPGQALSNPYTGVMAIFASRLLNGRPPIVFEDGNQLRDFVHVSDVVQAFRLALSVPEAAGRSFNIGSGQRISIREVATRMAQAMGNDKIRPEVTSKYRVGDIRHCFADIGEARRILGFQPRIPFEEGMRGLVAWLAGQRPDDRTRQMREELSAKGLAV